MSKITIRLPEELVSELMELIPSKNKTEAVIKAVKDEILRQKKARILEMAVKAEFIDDIETLRHEDRRLG